MDSRLCYLLTRLPHLPPLDQPLPITLEETLDLLRRQGGEDLERLADVFAAEGPLREALDEWVVTLPGSRAVPATLPPALQSLFDEDKVAAMSEESWVGAVWDTYLGLLSEAGHHYGSRLLTRWSAWEADLRLGVARQRERLRGDPGKPGPEHTAPGGTVGLAAAMETEFDLDLSRFAFLEQESPRYSFTRDELVAYLLQLRLHERRRRWDRQRGRALLEEIVAP